jgi:nucleotide-binding universal stress UspA family protein
VNAPASSLFRTILVPHDLSEPAAVAVAVAADLAAVHGGRLVVLHVIPPTSGILDYAETLAPADPGGDAVTRVRRELERCVARSLTGRHAPAIECRVAVGHPVTCILEAARSVDAIVMPTLGHSALSRVLIGSVAEHVIRNAPVPVVTIGPATIRRHSAQAERAANRALRAPPQPR